MNDPSLIPRSIIATGVLLLLATFATKSLGETSALDEESSLRRRLVNSAADLKVVRQNLEQQVRKTDLLEQKLEATRSERNDAEQNLHRTRFQLYRLEAEGEILEQQLDQVNAEFAALKENHGALKKLRADLVVGDQKVARLKAEIEVLRAAQLESAGPVIMPEANQLRAALNSEREHRRTLETELSRLVGKPETQKQLENISESLQLARAEILVLSNRLADDQRARESLEIAIQRIRKEGNLPPGTSADTLGRLMKAMKERRGEADRLSHELSTAKEFIVRLKGQLETVGSPEENTRLLLRLEEENQKLQEKVSAADSLNHALHKKAALAERLAEMLYGAPGG